MDVPMWESTGEKTDLSEGDGKDDKEDDKEASHKRGRACGNSAGERTGQGYRAGRAFRSHCAIDKKAQVETLKKSIAH